MFLYGQKQKITVVSAIDGLQRCASIFQRDLSDTEHSEQCCLQYCCVFDGSYVFPGNSFMTLFLEDLVDGGSYFLSVLILYQIFLPVACSDFLLHFYRILGYYFITSCFHFLFFDVLIIPNFVFGLYQSTLLGTL